MEQMFSMFAAYIAATLVNTGAVPPPRNEQEKDMLIGKCLMHFLDFLQKQGMAQVQRVEINAPTPKGVN